MNKNAELRHHRTESKCQKLLWSDTTAIHLMDSQLSRFENLKVFATGQFIRQRIKDEWIQCILGEAECSSHVSLDGPLTVQKEGRLKNADISCSDMCSSQGWVSIDSVWFSLLTSYWGWQAEGDISISPQWLASRHSEGQSRFMSVSVLASRDMGKYCSKQS